MPLKSKAQAAYLKKNKPELYEKFSAKTKKGVKLPDRVPQAQKARVTKVKKI